MSLPISTNQSTGIRVGEKSCKRSTVHNNSYNAFALFVASIPNGSRMLQSILSRYSATEKAMWVDLDDSHDELDGKRIRLKGKFAVNDRGNLGQV